jgi:hypothetical protein
MRLLRALRLYLGSSLTWKTARRLAKREPRYQLTARDGFLYIEPRA